MTKVRPHLPENIAMEYEEDILKMDGLPVGLRYRLDTWDFRGNRQDEYYDTIGSDHWLKKIQEALSKLIDFSNEKLSSHSRIVAFSELSVEVMEPRYEKYI